MGISNRTRYYIGAAWLKFQWYELWTTTTLESESLINPRTWVTINENPSFGILWESIVLKNTEI
jgi:hypothetical protein